MSREYLYLVEETSYGTPKTTPTLGTNSFYIRLDDGNAFAVDDEPVPWEIMSGQGLAIPALAGTDHFKVAGALKTKLYAGAQSKFLMDWAATRINAGRTTPFVTTDAGGVMPIGDLASVSCYHAFQQSDGTYKRTRYSGCKVAKWRVECSRESQLATLTLELMGIKPVGNEIDASSDPDATEFPFPALTDYPTTPYVFSNTAGGLKIGSTRTQYGSVVAEGTNTLDGRWYESQFLTLCRFTGRKVSLEAKLRLKVSPNDKPAQRQFTVQDSELEFDNGTNTLKLDFHGNGHVSGLPRDLPLDKEYERTLKLMGKLDTTAGTDFTVSAT